MKEIKAKCIKFIENIIDYFEDMLMLTEEQKNLLNNAYELLKELKKDNCHF